MIWVIGCKGMLGTEICRQLTKNNIDYVKSDIDVDITNIDALRKFANANKVSWIINCAAYTAVDKAESDIELASKLNKTAPENIAKIAKECKATVIHISTDYVFDGSANTPRTEEMPIEPIGVYGITKAAGEKSISNNTDKYYILRTAWLYGWAGKNFVYTMIKAMNTHKSIKVVSDQKGTPTFAGDLAKTILKIIEKGNTNLTIPYGIYHYTNLGETTWWEFAKEIQNQFIKFNNGKIPDSSFILPDCIINPCTTEEYPTPAKRPAYSVLCKDKIQNALGIEIPQWKESLSVFLKSELFDNSRIK